MALVLAKVDAIPAWRALMGPTNSLTAKAEAPDTLRARYVHSEKGCALRSLHSFVGGERLQSDGMLSSSTSGPQTPF